jgi:hypothetical protein
MTARPWIRTVAVMSSYASSIARIPGFEHLKGPQLASIARAAERIEIAPGEPLMRSGEAWCGAYIVVAGQALARVGGSTFLLTPGARIECTRDGCDDLTVVAYTNLTVLAVGRRELGGVPVVRPAHDRKMYSLRA